MEMFMHQVCHNEVICHPLTQVLPDLLSRKAPLSEYVEPGEHHLTTQCKLSQMCRPTELRRFVTMCGTLGCLAASLDVGSIAKSSASSLFSGQIVIQLVFPHSQTD